MSKKPFVISDLAEDEGGPHWLSPAGKKPQKTKPKTKPKGLDQIRREYRAKHKVKMLRQRSSDHDTFMSQCVSTLLEESGGSEFDAFNICETLWEDGEDFDSHYYRHSPGGHAHDQSSHGNWSDGLGDDDIAHSKTPASDLLEKNHREEISLEDLKAQLSPEFKVEAAKAEAEMKGKMVTSKQFTGPDGKYVPERAALHRSIIRKLFTPEKINAATPKNNIKPTLILSGGRPAAGKTSSLKNDLDKKIKTSFYINADEIQEMLPGYKGRHVGLYNAEAQDIALQAEKVARHMGLNIIYDATLKSKQPALERVLNYKGAGYEVDGYFVHTTPATTVFRSESRFMSDPDGNGRYLPPEISYNSRTNESTFDSLIPYLREWALYDNNGAKPVRVAGNMK